MEKFKVGDLVRIVYIRKFDSEGEPYEDLSEYVGLERKITNSFYRYKTPRYVLEGLDLYAWYEDELELVNTNAQPVTEEELLSCFGREDD